LLKEENILDKYVYCYLGLSTNFGILGKYDSLLFYSNLALSKAER
jgi:hypothetical protein